MGRGNQSKTAKEPGLTWVSCIAGDASALKLCGELPGKQYIGQLTVGICSQLLLPAHHRAVQACEVKAPSPVGSGGYHHHAARGACLQPGQQQVCQQEGADVVYSQQQVKGLTGLSAGTDPWVRD